MKKISALLAAILMLLPLGACMAEETAITDSLSLSLPDGILSFTAEEAAENEQLRAVIAAVSDGSENLYIGALPADGEGLATVYIIQREPETQAATGVASIGTYADTNEFALGLSEWYKEHYPDFYVVDVLSGQGGAPVFVVHLATEDGIALLAETYSTGYSDTIVACFLDGDGYAIEPTQAQYDAFAAMLKTISVM